MNSTIKHLPLLALAMVLLPVAGRARSDDAPAFYYGLNLNGPPVVIDGNAWEGSDSNRYAAQANAFENQRVVLNPPVDDERARMIRSSRWGQVDIAIHDVAKGTYSVFVYVWEDNNAERFSLSLNGREVLPRYQTGPEGRWERLGPWHVSVDAGTIRLTTRGGAANLSGIEVWRGRVSRDHDPAGRISDEHLAFFESRIRPVLVRHCYECHSAGAETVESELWLDSRSGVLAGGDTGPAVVPGDVDRSLLIRAIRYDDDLQMPPAGRLPAEQIADLERWVRLGAPDPRTDQALAEQRKQQKLEDAQRHWSFQPLRAPAVPDTGPSPWPRNEIDHFVLERLNAAQRVPVGDADRRTLVRRATFDLIGLPPTPDEVRAFVDDPRPDAVAFAELVERLLASPHYGERWGRHWMDLVRYADTAGDNSDYPVPQLYLYRNYVIDSLNADKPYDRFVREQIAGDQLPFDSAEQRNEQLIATGYIAMSRRFGSIIEGYPQHLTIEDTLDNIGRTVLGLTITCARCHHHKFDAISSEDYYGLYGIFESTRYPFPGIELDKKPRDLIELAAAADAPAGLAYAVCDASPADARLHRRGDPNDLAESVPRRFLDILGGARLSDEAAGSSSGRLQLAHWLTDPANPLTARVMVNRIWQFHFGTGLVATPSDFGTRGEPPSHPELLDWLAARFIAGGWSIKQMHRLIMHSRAYQLASTDEARNLSTDPDNRLHWKFDRRRLDAESLRDALLAIGGHLDLSPLREPHPFPPPDKWEYTQHHPFRDSYESHRRSVYLMTARLNARPFFTTFDGPDRNAITAVRDSSVTTIQALYLLNDEFLHEQATGFARRVLAEGTDDAGRVTVAFELALGRPPTEAERAAAETHVSGICESGEGDAEARRLVAWQSFARVLFRINEFLYID